MEKVSADLGPVQEALLIPLHERARDARARRPVLGDRLAAELVERIDHDFSILTGPSPAGSVLRTAIVDGWVGRFLREHPDGTVVELGSGLTTRRDRLDDGRAHWVDLDLPDTIALRRRFFDDTDRSTMIAGSVLDTDWFDRVAAAPGPYFFVSETVLLHLAADEVRTVVARLGERFGGSRLAFDTGGRTMLEGRDLVDSRTPATPQREVGRGWPRRLRIGMPLLALVAPGLVDASRMHLYALR